MAIVKLSSKNQIVLPKEARDAMQLRGRDELLVVVKNGITVILPKPESYSKAVSGLGKGIYGKKYIQGERKSW